LLSDTAFLYEGGSGKATQGEIPDDMADLEHQVHDNLVEGIVVADDSLMERYLEGETIAPKELQDTLAKGVVEASVFPVVCGAATKLIGVDRLAQLICEIAPAPTARPPLEVQARDQTTQVPCYRSGQRLAVGSATRAGPCVC